MPEPAFGQNQGHAAQPAATPHETGQKMQSDRAAKEQECAKRQGFQEELEVSFQQAGDDLQTR